MSYEGLLQSTCTIQRETASADSRGIVTPTWENSATGVSCQLIQLSQREIIEAKGWGLDADYKVLLPAGTTVRSHPPDRIVVSSTNYLVRRVDTQRGKTLVAWAKLQD